MRNTAKIYTRLSRDEVGQSSTSDQERECCALAARLGITAVEVFGEEPGTSGFKDVARPVFDELMTGIQAGDVVLAWALDRLTRRGMEQAGAILRVLEERGARLVTVSDGVDTAQENSDINTGIRAIMAREYSKGISRNVKRGKASGAAAGRWQGGPRWYGYMVDPDGKWRGPQAVDLGESKILHEIRDRFVAGERFLQIAQDLNERQVPTSSGALWRAENMLRLISRKRYVGILEQNGIEYSGTWPAIFTTSQYVEIDIARHQAERMAHWPTSPTGARTYLLTGLLICSACGGKLRGAGKVRKGTFKRLYRCHACYKTVRSADPLELLVSRAVLYRLDTPDLGNLLKGDSNSGQEELREIADQVREAKQRLDDLVDDYASGLLNRSQFTRAKQTAQAALEAADGRLNVLMQQKTTIRLNVGQTLHSAWERESFDWKRRLLGLVVDRVTIKPSNTGGMKPADYWEGYRFRPEDIEISFKDVGVNL